MKLVIETSMSGTRYFARETVLYHHVTLIKIFQVWRGPNTMELLSHKNMNNFTNIYQKRKGLDMFH